METEEPEQVPADEIKTMSISDSQAQDQPPSSSNPTDSMSLDERYELIRGVAEECIQEDELRNLLAHKSEPTCYDGFEPSGRMHIAQGVLKAINVNKMTAGGCRVKIWIADWFAMLNNKMGGDLKKIETVGRYFIEIWRSVGMNLDSGKVEFLWSSKEINARAHEYWPRVMDIARRKTIRRITRCSQIMGRTEADLLTAAQVLYPCMQCADIFFLQADICQLGMDQRKVNMLAREYCDEIEKKNKPIILSHHMLPGLQQGQEKMSKSDPSSSIFMEDEEAEVNTKIKKAYCPPEKVEGNPCLEYVKYLIFPWFHEFTVERSEKNGGNRTFTTFEELSAAYASGEVHPGDLKPSLAKALNKILEPVRSHFKKDKSAKQLLQSVKALAMSNAKTGFNQPGRKTRRRITHLKKALRNFPRPSSGPLRPVVHGQTFKYRMKVRDGRAFTLEELKAAGISKKVAPSIGIAVDQCRKNRSFQCLQANVQLLQTYKKQLVV